MMILKEFSRIVCVSLFSYQGSFVLFRSLATAHLVYHVRFRLSRTFLSFFKTFSNSFVISSLISNSFTLPHSFLNVKHFFEVF